MHIVHDYGLLCFKSTMFRHPNNCESICGQCQPRVISSRAHDAPNLVVGVSAAVIEEHERMGLFRSAEKMVMYPEVGVDRSRQDGVRDIPLAYLGRIGVEKGLDTLADAANLLGEEVVVAGDGTAHEVESLRHRSPHLNFVGRVNSEAFLPRVHTLVVPSLWREPFGRVVREAMLAGARVVIADQAGLTEAARVSEGRWMSFEPGNAAALAQAVTDLRNGAPVKTAVGTSSTRAAVAERIVQLGSVAGA